MLGCDLAQARSVFMDAILASNFSMGPKGVFAKVMWFVVAALLLSCGGHQSITPQSVPQQLDVCNCTPTGPASSDFRHNQKHVPLPNSSAQEITVATMLTWPQTPVPGPDAPRAGRELQMFHIAHAFVQLSYEVQSDCDIHVEISDSADKTAARAIVETPVDGEYCTARRSFQTQMAAQGFTVGTLFTAAEVPQPVPVDVLGLAFLDNPHSGRGSAQVQTIWEIHPAIIKVGP
jgi:hypothetical protein